MYHVTLMAELGAPHGVLNVVQGVRVQSYTSVS